MNHLCWSASSDSITILYRTYWAGKRAERVATLHSVLQHKREVQSNLESGARLPKPVPAKTFLSMDNAIKEGLGGFDAIGEAVLTKTGVTDMFSERRNNLEKSGYTL